MLGVSPGSWYPLKVSIYLINEQHTRYKLSNALVNILVDNLVDLFSQLFSDLSLFWLKKLTHHGHDILTTLSTNAYEKTPSTSPQVINITCGLALATSKSCSVTSWITSFFLWTSPLGNGTYSSASKSNSEANASDRPTRYYFILRQNLLSSSHKDNFTLTAPVFASI